jgi:hypothetical protein
VQYSLGDKISGKFTFEPASGGGSKSFRAVQPYNFFLDINGVSLFTQSFEIEAIDNVLVISDSPPSGVTDQLFLGTNGLSWVENTSPLPINPNLSGFRMTLYGMPSLLSQGSHPEDVNIWNDFDLWRQLNVTFRNGAGGAVGFQATIGDFATVPEASSLALGALAVSLILLSFRR